MARTGQHFQNLVESTKQQKLVGKATISLPNTSLECSNKGNYTLLSHSQYLENGIVAVSHFIFENHIL